MTFQFYATMADKFAADDLAVFRDRPNTIHPERSIASWMDCMGPTDGTLLAVSVYISIV
jgi:hypothetical protein